jgi:hypothetical protein
MEKLQSLADILGVADPTSPDVEVLDAPTPPTSPTTRSEGKLTAKTLAREILNSKQYRESLMRRIVMDELPPAVECMLYHYAYGKPVENLQVKDVTNRFENVPLTQLEARVTLLTEQLRKMRSGEPPTLELPESVH